MPRALLLLLVVPSLIVAIACAPEPREQPPFIVDEFGMVGTSGDSTTAAIIQLEREWVAAIVNKDTAALDRLLAPEFSGTSPTGHVYTKHMALEDLARGTYAVDGMTLDEASVNVYRETAVAFTSQEEHSRYAGMPVSGHYHYTNVWVNTGGRWRVVASHGSRVDAGHDATVE